MIPKEYMSSHQTLEELHEKEDNRIVEEYWKSIVSDLELSVNNADPERVRWILNRLYLCDTKKEDFINLNSRNITANNAPEITRRYIQIKYILSTYSVDRFSIFFENIDFNIYQYPDIATMYLKDKSPTNLLARIKRRKRYEKKLSITEKIKNIFL